MSVPIAGPMDRIVKRIENAIRTSIIPQVIIIVFILFPTSTRLKPFL